MATNQAGQFAGKVAFVTGAGTGIGRAAALAFAREGAQVAVVGITPADNDETVRLVTEQGGKVLAMSCDTTDEPQVQAALAQTIEAFGRLDFAFNNAGVEQHKAPAAELEMAEWDRIVNTDLRGTFLCMKHEIPLILAQGGGAIVNTSSGAGLIGVKNNAAYCAAKHGVVGLTRSAALDYAPYNLRINVVCPGYIDTPMMDRFTHDSEKEREQVIEQEPIGRAGLPEEIANAAVWLCSQSSSFVVGHALAVDGGQVII
ncbi:glucose 1-dehydrogenase [Hymenobacter metallicola]|uniref:SDR family oxidoreductase n=1 Tax=Hymenobacter metallicola TaxID=2563114 RepID=A0A4Z0PZQ8_9BACT|nr:glucose 1-dehydrogenase [Hymenobacter metallicola]TGE22726.1 SDR family oxidoreductase [Hymenobacter metallicola]